MIGSVSVDRQERWSGGDRFGHLSLDAMDGTDPDLELACGGVDAGALRQFPTDAIGLGRVEGWTAALLGAAGKTSHDPLPEDAAFELGKNAQHREHRAARWCRRVEALGMEIQVDTTVVDLAKEAHEMLERSSQTINRPTCDEVDFPARNHLHETIISRTLIPTLCPADSFVGQFDDDVPAQTIRHSHEFAALVIHRLGIGRDPKIESDAFHAGRFSHLENGLKHFKYFDISKILWHAAIDVWRYLMDDLHGLRVGDLVVREIDNRGRVERHIGEVLSIRARIQYLDVGHDWREWWDVTTASLHPFRPLSMPGYRLCRAEVTQIDRLRLR